jgi:hypothetical protein
MAGFLRLAVDCTVALDFPETCVGTGSCVRLLRGRHVKDWSTSICWPNSSGFKPIQVSVDRSNAPETSFFPSRYIVTVAPSVTLLILIAVMHSISGSEISGVGSGSGSTIAGDETVTLLRLLHDVCSKVIGWLATRPGEYLMRAIPSMLKVECGFFMLPS